MDGIEQRIVDIQERKEETIEAVYARHDAECPPPTRGRAAGRRARKAQLRKDIAYVMGALNAPRRKPAGITNRWKSTHLYT